MHRKIALATLCAAVLSQIGSAQVLPPTILEIDIENYVQYVEDTSDLSRLATNPNVTTGSPPINFGTSVLVGDIVAVNGKPAKGTLLFNKRVVTLRPIPNAGDAVADIQRTGVVDQAYEILNSDGNPIGTIIATGLSDGPPPPGAPTQVLLNNTAIVGGTGAFLGARGYAGHAADTVPSRRASMTEDPANRRKNGGGKPRFVLQVIPMSQPQIVTTPNGPAVTHSSDFSLVTASKPASAGETLSLFATGLGPTVPGVDPGKPFPASPLAAVNSPVQVTVNGVSAQLLAAVGFPGAVDTYQVNFQVPPGTVKGMATVQVSAAWIAGPPVNIQVQ